MASRVERLVAERAGGIARLENLIAVCPTCAIFSDYRDALELAQQDGRVLSTAQSKQRENALALSLNHAVPSGYRTSRAVCREYLSAGRWSHPRVALAVAPVDGGVLAETISGPESAASSALLEMMERAEAKTVGSRCVFVPEDAWLAVAWEAIERHAVLRCVVLDRENAGLKDGGAGAAAWREGWDVLLEGVDDVRRNRARLPNQGFTARYVSMRSDELANL
jgi:hypothetical protein